MQSFEQPVPRRYTPASGLLQHSVNVWLLAPHSLARLYLLPAHYLVGILPIRSLEKAAGRGRIRER